MTEKEMYAALWDAKTKNLSLSAYGELTKDVDAVRYVKDPSAPKTKEEKYVIQSGTTVRVNMVSRLGDYGVTDRLDLPNGYNARGFKPGDGVLRDCRLTPQA